MFGEYSHVNQENNLHHHFLNMAYGFYVLKHEIYQLQLDAQIWALWPDLFKQSRRELILTVEWFQSNVDYYVRANVDYYVYR